MGCVTGVEGEKKKKKAKGIKYKDFISLSKHVHFPD